MNNIAIAKGYIEDAGIILEEAQASLNKSYYHRVMRKCQECVELSLKGLLRLIGVEYPKSHKIGRVLIDTLKNQDIELTMLQRVADISDQLAVDREPSFYGSEERSAKNLFDQEDAEGALRDARLVVNFVNDVLSKVT